MPSLDSPETAFNTQDYLNDMAPKDPDTSTTSTTDEHMRDFELDTTLPELIDITPEANASAPVQDRQDQKGLLDTRIDFSNSTQREILETQASIDEHRTALAGRKENNDAYPSILYKTQNAYRAEVWKGSNNQKILSNKYVITSERTGEKIECYTVDDKCLSFTT